MTCPSTLETHRNYRAILYLSKHSSESTFAGSDRHRRAETGLGGGEGGESDGEHLQTLPDQRAAQTVQGGNVICTHSDRLACVS